MAFKLKFGRGLTMHDIVKATCDQVDPVGPVTHPLPFNQKDPAECCTVEDLSKPRQPTEPSNHLSDVPIDRRSIDMHSGDMDSKKMDMIEQQYCLRWKYHHSNLQTMFSELLDRGCFCDVTLACEGQTIRAHRVVLCACSTYFDSLLTNCNTEKDPIILMRDCKFSDIKCLIEFMYKGEINVEHANLTSLLRTAEELRIKGLAEVSWRDDDCSDDNIGPGKNFLTEPQLIGADYRTRDSTESLRSMCKTTTTLIPSTIRLDCDSDDYSTTVQPMKRKRGRPPLDGEYENLTTPKIMHVESTHYSRNGGTVESIVPDTYLDNRTPDDDSSSDNRTFTGGHSDAEMVNGGNGRGDIDHDHDRGGDDDREMFAGQQSSWAEQNLNIHMQCDLDDDDDERNIIGHIVPKVERSDTPNETDSDLLEEESGPVSPSNIKSDSKLTPQEEEEWKDVIKMNDYLAKGRRPHFWEEPFCRRVMEAIKTKDLEMKKAAQLLGVSYGTLYGRYRETYGCLKHPYRGPFMASKYRDTNLWGEQSPAELLKMIQRGGIQMPIAGSVAASELNAGSYEHLYDYAGDPLEMEEAGDHHIRYGSTPVPEITITKKSLSLSES